MATPAPPKAAGLLKRAARLLGNAGETASPWLPMGTGYPRLLGFDPAAAGLMRVSGIYVCWHLGVRPRWIRTGAAHDLGAVLQRVREHEEITRHDANGGVYVAWALLAGDALSAAAAFLTAELQPASQSVVIAGEIAPAPIGASFPLPPGTRATS